MKHLLKKCIFIVSIATTVCMQGRLEDALNSLKEKLSAASEKINSTWNDGLKGKAIIGLGGVAALCALGALAKTMVSKEEEDEAEDESNQDVDFLTEPSQENNSDDSAEETHNKEESLPRAKILSPGTSCYKKAISFAGLAEGDNLGDETCLAEKNASDITVNSTATILVTIPAILAAKVLDNSMTLQEAQKELDTICDKSFICSNQDKYNANRILQYLTNTSSSINFNIDEKSHDAEVLRSIERMTTKIKNCKSMSDVTCCIKNVCQNYALSVNRAGWGAFTSILVDKNKQQLTT